MMRRLCTALSLTVIASGVASGFAPTSSAAVLYSSLAPATPPVLLTISGDGTAGTGDDYNIGTADVDLSGLSFYGELGTAPAGDAQDQLAISFYTLAGVKQTTLMPSTTGLTTLGLHTLQPGDFMQGGSGGSSFVTIPGRGYIIFSPVSYNTASVGPNGFMQTPADPNPTIQLGYGETATLGSNDPALAAQVNSAGTLSTGVYASGTGTAQIAAFSLSDSSVPEPVSIALFAPVAAMLSRRRPYRVVQ